MQRGSGADLSLELQGVERMLAGLRGSVGATSKEHDPREMWRGIKCTLADTFSYMPTHTPLPEKLQDISVIR